MNRSKLAFVLTAALAFVGGVVAGGAGPRAELRRAQEALFEAERAGARGGVGAELTGVLRRSLEEREAERGDVVSRGPTAPIDVRDGPLLPGEPGADAPSDADAVDPTDDDAIAGVGDFTEGAEGVEAAREVLDARFAQARAALVEDARPTPEQLDRIDDAVTRMNDRLAVLAESALSRFQDGGGQPGRRELLSFAADTLDVLATAESEMLSALDAGQRARVREEATDPLSFLDPSLIELLRPLGDGR